MLQDRKLPKTTRVFRKKFIINKIKNHKEHTAYYSYSTLKKGPRNEWILYN